MQYFKVHKKYHASPDTRPTVKIKAYVQDKLVEQTKSVHDRPTVRNIKVAS